MCNLCEAICGLVLTIEDGAVTGVRGNPDDPLRAATSARRASRSPTSTPIPTGCADPCARRATGEWQRDRLGRGVRPRSPTASPRRSTSTAATRVGIYLGNPNVHNLGSMTHGTGLVKALRTQNRFSATSVDQLPHQLAGAPDVRPPAADPDPRHRPHRLLPGPRRQPDGLERLAHDRARLAAPAARAQGARRPHGRLRSAAHRDRQGRRPSTTSSARAATRGSCWRCSTSLFAEGLAGRSAVRRRAGRGRVGASRTSRPSRGRADERRRRRRDRAHRARVRDRGRRRWPTAGSASRRRSSARSASGPSTCSTSSPATSTARAARCSPRPPSTSSAPA